MTSSTTDRRLGLTGGTAIKAPCACATTGNITLSGEQTIDGVTTSSSRVLVWQQTTTTQNGIYDSDSGTWTRAVDANASNEWRKGTLVVVAGGSTYGSTIFEQTTADPITIDSSSLAFSTAPTQTLPLSIATGGTGTTTAEKALAALGVMRVTSVGGTANVITGTVPANVLSLSPPQFFEFTPTSANTSSVTLNLTPSGGSAFTAKNVFYNNLALVGAELQANVPALLYWDGTQFQILSTGAALFKQNTAAAGDILAAPAAGANVYSSIAASGSTPINLALAASVGASALTISLKTKAASDPSTAAPVLVPFRNVTATTGDYAWLAVTSATTLTVSSGSTLGTVSNVPFRLWIVAFNDGGTFRLGVINCVTTVAGAGSGRDITGISMLTDDALTSSTAEGGAGNADSAQVIYTGTAVSAKAMRVLGYLEYGSGIATAGTWSAGPTKIQIWWPGISLPGRPTGAFARTDTGTSATGSTVVPFDNTIPQNNEGDQYMSQAITPFSATNILVHDIGAMFASSAVAGSMAMSLYQDATTLALKTASAYTPAAGQTMNLHLSHTMLSATTAATTFKVRAGQAGVGGTTFNGAAGAQVYGGVSNSYIDIREFMG